MTTDPAPPITGQLIVEANPSTDTFEISADEWAALTPAQRRELLADMAADHLSNSGGYGYSLDDTDREADLKDLDVGPPPAGRTFQQFEINAAERILNLELQLASAEQHLIDLNAIGWKVAAALGMTPSADGQIEANTVELVERLIAELDRLRADQECGHRHGPTQSACTMTYGHGEPCD